MIALCIRNCGCSGNRHGRRDGLVSVIGGQFGPGKRETRQSRVSTWFSLRLHSELANYCCNDANVPAAAGLLSHSLVVLGATREPEIHNIALSWKSDGICKDIVTLFFLSPETFHSAIAVVSIDR